MDESTSSAAGSTGKSNGRSTFGMNSFNTNDQQHVGRNVRLAMACTEGKYEPANIKALPDNEATLRQRLRTLTQEISSSQADLLELLVRFDELEGWRSSGARRVACAESPPSTYGFTKTRSSRRTRWATTEQSAVYHVNSSAYLHKYRHRQELTLGSGCKL